MYLKKEVVTITLVRKLSQFSSLYDNIGTLLGREVYILYTKKYGDIIGYAVVSKLDMNELVLVHDLPEIQAIPDNLKGYFFEAIEIRPYYRGRGYAQSMLNKILRRYKSNILVCCINEYSYRLFKKEQFSLVWEEEDRYQVKRWMLKRV